MATSTKLNVPTLKREVELLRSFVIGAAGRDPEGNYRPEFVRRVFMALREKPRYRFTDARSFLLHLSKRKA